MVVRLIAALGGIEHKEQELDEDSTKSEIVKTGLPYAQRGGGWYKIKSLV